MYPRRESSGTAVKSTSSISSSSRNRNPPIGRLWLIAQPYKLFASVLPSVLYQRHLPGFFLDLALTILFSLSETSRTLLMISIYLTTENLSQYTQVTRRFSRTVLKRVVRYLQLLLPKGLFWWTDSLTTPLYSQQNREQFFLRFASLNNPLANTFSFYLTLYLASKPSKTEKFRTLLSWKFSNFCISFCVSTAASHSFGFPVTLALQATRWPTQLQRQLSVFRYQTQRCRTQISSLW